MCIIVHRPANRKPLDEQIWRECWRMHKDGAGFAYFDEEGKLLVDRGYMTFQPLYDAIKKLEERRVEFVVHFRTASPGMVVNPENTHPFTFQGDIFTTKDGKPRFTWAVVHNGRLPWRSTSKQSDTSCFVQELLAPHLNRDPWLLDNVGFDLLELAITTGTCTNKMVIMRHDAETGKGNTYIINGNAGNRAHGGWFSNSSWEVRNFHHGNTGVYAGGSMGGMGFFGSEDSWDNGEAYLRVDTYGWAWSYKWDCWVNFDKKEWTDYLPYRHRPYNPDKLDKKPERPTGWKRVYVTGPTQIPTTPTNTSVGDRAEQNKPGDGGRILTLEGGIKDATAEEEMMGADSCDAGVGVPDLEHLSPDEKKLLCKEAVRYLRETDVTKADIRKMCTAEKIDWLRDGVRSIITEVAELNHIDLDMWMLAMIKDGNLEKKINDSFAAAADKSAAKSAGLN